MKFLTNQTSTLFTREIWLQCCGSGTVLSGRTEQRQNFCL